jgi:ATP-dependent DNA helicase RecG
MLSALLRERDGPGAPEVALITGGGSAAERRAQRQALASGRAALAVGTHGLASPSLAFRDLAVTVVDEQHRFGVRQRVRFRGQGEATHLLVMTATPIPRTLALTAYGELDVSVLDELPPGRAPRTTGFVAAAGQPALWRHLARRVADGERGYVVCPSISGRAPGGDGPAGDEPAPHSVAATLDAVRARLGPGVAVEAVHGRLPVARQAAVLDAFRAGAVQVLVATVLIEVGLDVPEATFVVVPDPSRFGLATLHQIRGRVGRGGRPGTCHLLGPVAEGPARARVTALIAGEDGFALAEQDLALRGPGELLGTRQSGMPAFAVLDPVRDVGLLAEERAAALAAAEGLSPARLRALRERAFPRIEIHAENLLAGG